MATIVTKQIAHNDDDCFVEDGTMHLNDNYIYIAFGTLHEESGFRFLAVNIPIGVSGVIISNTYLTFTADYDFAGALPDPIVIKAEKNATPARFSTAADFNARTRTTASVNYDPPDYVVDGEYNTGDLSALIQEIINSEGAITDLVFLTDHPGTNTKRRRVESHEGDSTKAAKLHLEYSIYHPRPAGMAVGTTLIF